MKKTFPLAGLLLTLTIMTIYAQTGVYDTFADMKDWNPVYGTWNADGSLVQSDTTAGMAMINRKLPQSGVYQLEYTAKYLDGGYKDENAASMDKYHGGFGMHIGIDKPSAIRSWGNGKSYLLWFNLDTEVSAASEYYGLRAQVYESTSNSRMSLMKDYNAEIMPIEDVIANLDYLSENLEVKMIVDTDTGEIKVYDPTLDNYYYSIYLDPAMLKGNYVSFRTNRLSMAFDDFKITKLP